MLMRPKGFCVDIKQYQNILSNANSTLNFDLAPGLYLNPSDLTLKPDLMREYNIDLLQTPASAFGLVVGINGINKKVEGPLTPNLDVKNPIKAGDKKPDNSDKMLDTGNKKTEIGQEGGKLLTEHQSELNTDPINASLLVLPGFALQYVMS